MQREEVEAMVTDGSIETIYEGVREADGDKGLGPRGVKIKEYCKLGHSHVLLGLIQKTQHQHGRDGFSAQSQDTEQIRVGADTGRSRDWRWENRKSSQHM